MESELATELKTGRSVETKISENKTFSEDSDMTPIELDPVHYPKFIYIVVTSEYGRTWIQEQTPFLNLEKAIDFAKSLIDEGDYYDVIVKKYEITNDGQNYQEGYEEFHQCHDD